MVTKAKSESVNDPKYKRFSNDGGGGRFFLEFESLDVREPGPVSVTLIVKDFLFRF